MYKTTRNCKALNTKSFVSWTFHDIFCGTRANVKCVFCATSDAVRDTFDGVEPIVIHTKVKRYVDQSFVPGTSEDRRRMFGIVTFVWIENTVKIACLSYIRKHQYFFHFVFCYTTICRIRDTICSKKKK